MLPLSPANSNSNPLLSLSASSQRYSSAQLCLRRRPYLYHQCRRHHLTPDGFPFSSPSYRRHSSRRRQVKKCNSAGQLSTKPKPTHANCCACYFPCFWSCFYLCGALLRRVFVAIRHWYCLQIIAPHAIDSTIASQAPLATASHRS